MIIDIMILLALTLLNGLLAMSELAIVSARPARLKVLAARGSRGAAMALRLAEEPGRFLSSVQIGITLVGILSGAISGATLGLRLSEALQAMGLSHAMSSTLGVVLGTWSTLYVAKNIVLFIGLDRSEKPARKKLDHEFADIDA